MREATTIKTNQKVIKYLTFYIYGLSIICVVTVIAVASLYAFFKAQPGFNAISANKRSIVYPGYISLPGLTEAVLLLLMLLLPPSCVTAIWAIKKTCAEYKKTAVENGALRDQNRMIIETRKKQEQNIQFLSKLTCKIAIEFCGMLKPIIGYTSVLKENIPQNNPMHADIDEICNSSRRAMDVIQQFSVIGGRVHDYEKTPLKLSEVMPQVINALEAVKPDYISTETAFTYKDEAISGNQTLIIGMFMNIFTNACESIGRARAVETAAGLLHKTGSVKLKGGAVSRNGKQYARISIQDDGPGVNGPDVEYIFEPHFTTKHSSEGAGLGLTFVKKIIEHHDGAIKIENSPGRGFTFIIEIPIID